MDARDLAREVVAYAQPQDRSSPLVLVVYCPTWRGRDVRNEHITMRITAPVENGRLILRLTFPTPNYTPTLGQNDAQNDNVSSARIILEYDGVNNLEGAASCIEGFMTCRANYGMMLFKMSENGNLGPISLAKWDLSFQEERGNQTASRLQIIQQILRSLLVM